MPNNLYKTVCVKQCPMNDTSVIQCASNSLYKNCDSSAVKKPMRILGDLTYEEENNFREDLYLSSVKSEEEYRKTTERETQRRKYHLQASRFDLNKINVYSSVPCKKIKNLIIVHGHLKNKKKKKKKKNIF